MITLNKNGNSNIVKPFLRWAGGKTWLIKYIPHIITFKFENYHEPFLGSGSLYFHLFSNKKINKNAFLSDSNSDLINAFMQVKNNLDKVICYLNEYKNDEYFYYKIRNKVAVNDHEKAAIFIYLNRTSFNGIYRVNRKGVYNVPFGFKKYKELFNYNNFNLVKNSLRKVRFFKGDFSRIINNINENDFIFFDPPYTVAHSNNGFIKYNQKLFSLEDQKRLSNLLREIDKKKAYFLLTNAKHENIKRIFSNHAYTYELDRPSVIGGKLAKRETITEYIFTNFLVKELNKA